MRSDSVTKCSELRTKYVRYDQRKMDVQTDRTLALLTYIYRSFVPICEPVMGKKSREMRFFRRRNGPRDGRMDGRINRLTDGWLDAMLDGQTLL